MKYSQTEVDHLDIVDSLISNKSEMIRAERQFLNGLIRTFRPKKILEVGIAAGSSSVVILNAIRDIDGALLHSVDYSKEYYRDASKLSGYMVHECVPELEGKWKLHAGGIAARFMDEIGGDIDMCIMDTAHFNPGEFLDFLMVLPYLKKNCIFVLHDISYHTWNPKGVTCGVLISAIEGEKIIPEFPDVSFPNIGAVKLNKDQNPWNIFNLLTLPWDNWSYLRDDDWNFLKQFFARHYDEKMQLLFSHIVDYKNGKKEIKKNKVQPEDKLSLKNVGNFIKSYLFFPWYVYKTYKIMERNNKS